MYKNNVYSTEVNIHLESGVFVFDEKFATGKTRLCKELKELRKLGEPVIGYSFGDENLGINLVDLCDKVNPKVLLLDRYNMYNGMFNDAIMKWANDTIILIDCKGNLKLDIEADWCTIKMGPRIIEVKQ